MCKRVRCVGCREGVCVRGGGREQGVRRDREGEKHCDLLKHRLCIRLHYTPFQRGPFPDFSNYGYFYPVEIDSRDGLQGGK